MMSRALLTLAAGILLAALAACNDDGAPAAPPETPTLDSILVTFISTDQPSYAPGQPIHFTVALENRGTEPLVIAFPICQRYDFFVVEGSELVWQWSADQAFCLETGEERLEPGETLTYSETWDQLAEDGTDVEPGKYRVRGAIEGCPPGEDRCTLSDTRTFEILAP